MTIHPSRNLIYIRKSNISHVIKRPRVQTARQQESLIGRYTEKKEPIRYEVLVAMTSRFDWISHVTVEGKAVKCFV